MMSNDRRVQPRPQVFWGEMAPSEHLVQIYENDDVFLDMLHGFVAGGLRNGEGVVVIATAAHRRALASHLLADRIDILEATALDRYIALDAQETLDGFMVNGWPDEDLFEACVTRILERAGRDGRRVRAFGEMVALMWGQGWNGATVRLEFLWNKICRKEGLALFCSYPKSGFTDDAKSSLREICNAHSRVLAG